MQVVLLLGTEAELLQRGVVRAIVAERLVLGLVLRAGLVLVVLLDRVHELEVLVLLLELRDLLNTKQVKSGRGMLYT